MEFYDIDKKLQVYRLKKKIWGWISAISFLMFIISLGLDYVLWIVISAFMLVISIAMSTNNGAKCSKIDSDIFNQYLLPNLEASFRDFQYNSQDGIDQAIIEKLKFIDAGNKIATHDLMEGYYRDVSFVESGVLCQYEHEDSKGNIIADTKFTGRVIILGISMFSDDAVAELISHNTHTRIGVYSLRKVTLNSEAEKYYDVYVSKEGLSLPLRFLHHMAIMAKTFPDYDINVRIEKDRMYISIRGIERKAYSLESLETINKENLDILLKKDSYFITNTISSILD